MDEKLVYVYHTSHSGSIKGRFTVLSFTPQQFLVLSYKVSPFSYYATEILLVQSQVKLKVNTLRDLRLNKGS